MLTVQDVAQRLRVSPQIVYALIAKGRLVAHRIGLGRGTIRVEEAELRRYLDTCKQQHAPQPASRSRKRIRLRHIKLD
ncbi:MAG: helix-turn-helix domain-containing protein [Planctomycetaceae bacterium]|nr:helix-turn-helix domain-containing protein [Planctomycetaceae bacterium]